MRKLILLSAIAIISVQAMQAQKSNNHQVLRHVVMFGWDAGTDSANIKKIVAAFSPTAGQDQSH